MLRHTVAYNNYYFTAKIYLMTTYPTGFITAYSIILKNEGGYNVATTGAGETYMGVDRREGRNGATWAGWQIIDAVKARGVKLGEEDYIQNVQLEELVKKYWYENYWLYANFHMISNKQLANMMFDFYAHKPAILLCAVRFIRLNKVEVKDIILNLDDIKAINAEPSKFYERIFNLRIAHYNNAFANNFKNTRLRYIGTQKGVLRRANSFSPTLTDYAVNIQKKNLVQKIARFIFS